MKNAEPTIGYRSDPRLSSLYLSRPRDRASQGVGLGRPRPPPLPPFPPLPAITTSPPLPNSLTTHDNPRRPTTTRDDPATDTGASEPPLQTPVVIRLSRGTSLGQLWLRYLEHITLLCRKPRMAPSRSLHFRTVLGLVRETQLYSHVFV